MIRWQSPPPWTDERTLQWVSDQLLRQQEREEDNAKLRASMGSEAFNERQNTLLEVAGRLCDLVRSEP